MTDQEIVAGRGDIAQASGTLGLNLYASFGGIMKTLFSSADLGQGSGAVAWLAGDFTGSGHAEIAQLWDNNGTLAVIVYRVSGTTVTVESVADLGQGTGALVWLADNFTAGLTVIAQPWDS